MDMDNHVVLRLSQRTIASYEECMPKNVGNRTKYFRALVPMAHIWTFTVGDGLELDMQTYRRGSEAGGPEVAEVTLSKDGFLRGYSGLCTRVSGTFKCYDAKDNNKEYTFTVLPEGDSLAIMNPDQLLDTEEFAFDMDDDIRIGYGSEAEPQLKAHVDYPLSTEFFDSRTTFGVDFDARESVYNKELNSFLPQRKAFLRWHAEAEKVSMFVSYYDEKYGVQYRVILNDEVEQQLKKLLFVKAKETHGKTPAEEWAAWKK